MSFIVSYVEDGLIVDDWAIFFNNIEEAYNYIVNQVNELGMAYSDFIIRPRMLEFRNEWSSKVGD